MRGHGLLLLSIMGEIRAIYGYIIRNNRMVALAHMVQLFSCHLECLIGTIGVDEYPHGNTIAARHRLLLLLFIERYAKWAVVVWVISIGRIGTGLPIVCVIILQQDAASVAR
jgi:hypothetical protein